MYKIEIKKKKKKKRKSAMMKRKGSSSWYELSQYEFQLNYVYKIINIHICIT